MLVHFGVDFLGVLGGSNAGFRIILQQIPSKDKAGINTVYMAWKSPPRAVRELVSGEARNEGRAGRRKVQ